MQFYQKRDFGTLISDTFAFFKENGKNYFKNYFLINGLLLILLVVIFIFGYRELFSQLAGNNLNGQNFYFQAYFEENRGILIAVFLLVFLLFLTVSMIAYSYPVLYMKRLSETGNKNITADEILGDLKRNFGRFFLFLLGLVFIIMPLCIILIGVSYVLIFVLIGFFLLLLLMPALINVVNFLLFDYFHTQKGFFESLSYAVRAQFSYPSGREKSPFWKYWGSTVIIYIIVQVVNTVFTLVPMLIVMFSMYTVPKGNEPVQNPFLGTTGILIFIIYGVSLLLSFVLLNIVYVNSGLQYYDSRTDLHRNLNLSEIDTIGKNEG